MRSDFESETRAKNQLFCWQRGSFSGTEKFVGLVLAAILRDIDDGMRSGATDALLPTDGAGDERGAPNASELTGTWVRLFLHSPPITKIALSTPRDQRKWARMNLAVDPPSPGGNDFGGAVEDVACVGALPRCVFLAQRQPTELTAWTALRLQRSFCQWAVGARHARIFN